MTKNPDENLHEILWHMSNKMETNEKQVTLR